MTGETASGVAGTADLTPPPSGSDVSATPLAPFHFTVPGRPRTQGSATLAIDPRTGKPRMLKRRGETAHREAVAWQARQAAAKAGWTPQHTGPVLIDADFYLARKGGQAPDLDKLLRLIFDALVVGHVLKDDSQVMAVTANKFGVARPDDECTTVRIWAEPQDPQ